VSVLREVGGSGRGGRGRGRVAAALCGGLAVMAAREEGVTM
jgi:hypothetical protein